VQFLISNWFGRVDDKKFKVNIGPVEASIEKPVALVLASLPYNVFLDFTVRSFIEDSRGINSNPTTAKSYHLVLP
jgi:hypothetical protein